MRNVPPFLGSARAALTNIVWAVVAVKPAASASWTNWRRETFPRPTSFSASFSFSMLSDIETSLLRVWQKRSCPLPSAGQLDFLRRGQAGGCSASARRPSLRLSSYFVVRCVAPDLARSAGIHNALTDLWARQSIPTSFPDRFLTYSDRLKSLRV